MTSGVVGTGPLQLLVGLVGVLWILSEFVGAGLLPSLRRSGSRVAVRSDRGSRGEILLGIFAGWVIDLVFARLGLATLPALLVYAGVALILAGIALRQWAIRVLGKFFSTSVQLLEGHTVVRAGPYRLVRHPSYSGLLVSLVGLGLVGGSWEGFVAVVGLGLAVVGYRIRVEERFLLDHLGAEYARYMAGTKRLVPFLV